MNRKLGWGIIGCGEVVLKKSGPSIQQAGRSRIVAVMRRDIHKARPFAEANRVSLCTSDASEVIEHPDVKVVYVATPPSSHREYVLAAAQAGKHVLVEKPMGMSVAEDCEMIDACKKAGVELFVSYYRRFHPHVIKMKALIDAGCLGKLTSTQIDYAQAPIPRYDWGWRVKPEVSGGGLFADVVSHRINLLEYLLGEPEEVCGMGTEFYSAESRHESVVLAAKFQGGVACGISGDFASMHHADRFMIVGTKGFICSERLDGHSFSFVSDGDTRNITYPRDSTPHLGLIRHIERVLSKCEANLSPGRAGMLTDFLLAAALSNRPFQVNTSCP